MFERILIPLDGSQTSEISLPYAEELANKFGSELILYHVRGQDHMELERVHQAYLDKMAEDVRQITQGETNKVNVTFKIESGEPAQKICDLVEKKKIDLIVMTSVSTSGKTIGKNLGSVADHICRTVPVPVLLIRPKGFHRLDDKKSLITKILIPVDGSDLSKLALPVGEELARRLNVPIALFQMATVIYPYTFHDYVAGIEYPGINERGERTVEYDYAEANKEEERTVIADMIELEKELREKGLNATQSVTSGIDAAHEIIQQSKEYGIDLIVMATHGRSGLDRWVLGSVAEKVLRYGETPLLLVNARAT